MADAEGFDKTIIQRASRLARDFMKLRKSLLDLAHAEGETKNILEAIRDKKFALTKNGKKHRHAEMRHVDALDPAALKPHVGLSKLCCDKCALVLEILDVPTRGRHGRSFSRWELPTLFKETPALFKRFLGEAHTSYEMLSPQEKTKAITIIETSEDVKPTKVPRGNMLADSSESDVSFGLSDVEAEHLTVGDLVKAADFKKAEEEIYQIFLNMGLDIQAISRFYRTSSQERLVALSSDRVQKLLASEFADFTALCDLYDEDEELFDYVMEDPKDLILRRGYFEEVCERYRKDLVKKQANANSEENYSGEDMGEVDSLSDDEEAWDYDDVGSEDSANRFQYRYS